MQKLVVIDDDVDTLEVFTAYLSLKEFDVAGQGNNGKEAVELFEKHKPDVVLMDVMMPEYDGFYGLQKIKELNPEAKVIMVTADLTDSTFKKLQDLGATEILYKPYEIEDVVKTINKIFSKENRLVAS